MDADKRSSLPQYSRFYLMRDDKSRTKLVGCNRRLRICRRPPAYSYHLVVEKGVYIMYDSLNLLC